MRTPSFPSLAAALLLAATAAGAQRSSALKGRVLTDSMELPVLGAEITIKDVRGAAISDSVGHFLFASVPPGKQIVTVRRLGYSPLTAVLTFTAGDTLEGDFLLMSTAQRLRGVEIRSRSNTPTRLVEFDKRRKAGFGGNFIGPDQLEKMENRRTDDVLRTIPGPFIVRSNVSTSAWIAGGRMAVSKGSYTIDRMDRQKGADSEKCYATVYLDGVAVFSAFPGETLFDVNTVPPSTIYGMEYYSGASTIPPQFPEKRNTCGVLVIWTKG